MRKRASSSAYLGWLASVMTRAAGGPAGAARAPDDLILGYATGYDAADIAPFVRSMRSVYDGEAVLVTDDRADVAELLAAHDVTAVTPQTSEGWSPHPVVARFAAFDRLMTERPHVRSVLITDVRDVVFQGAPFAPRPRTLELFVEAEDAPLARHAFNMKHLNALVGPELAQALGDKPCLCVGTVMGPREAMIRFCRTVLMLSAIPRSEVGGAFGADQAACNLAAHLGLVESEIRANYGRVATLGLTPGETLTVRDGRIVNPDGSTSPIVHQHDRHPHLAALAHDLWGQGLEQRDRVRPRTLESRRKQWHASILRRLPELR